MKDITYKNIVDVINKVVGCELTAEQLDVNLVELGMDSIKFIELVIALEESFDCEIPDSKLLFADMDTVKKIFDVLKTVE